MDTTETFDPLMKENYIAEMPKQCSMCKGSKKFTDPKREGRCVKCPKCSGRGYKPTKQ